MNVCMDVLHVLCAHRNCVYARAHTYTYMIMCSHKWHNISNTYIHVLWHSNKIWRTRSYVYAHVQTSTYTLLPYICPNSDALHTHFYTTYTRVPDIEELSASRDRLPEGKRKHSVWAHKNILVRGCIWLCSKRKRKFLWDKGTLITFRIFSHKKTF